MATKKNADPPRTIMVQLPESLLMKVVEAANNSGVTTHEFVNPIVERTLRGIV